jgi:hypothetical protein
VYTHVQKRVLERGEVVSFVKNEELEEYLYDPQKPNLSVYNTIRLCFQKLTLISVTIYNTNLRDANSF